jgi:hypothetical protein
LQSVFKTINVPAVTGGKNDFFWKFYVPYFSKLADTDLVPALASYISLSVKKEESLKWIQENPKKLDEFGTWVKGTRREMP